jgi:hypothetical protein
MSTAHTVAPRFAPGVAVKTKEGAGTLIKREGIEGVLAERWLVKMDGFDGFHSAYREGLSELQNRQGGLYLFQDHLTPLPKVSP